MPCYGVSDPVKVTVPLPANGLVKEAALVGVTFQVSLPLPVSGEPVALFHGPGGVTASVLVFFFVLVVMQALAGAKSILITYVPIVRVSVLAPRTV